MSKLFYRGFEVRAANDNAVKAERHEDLVYRGSHYDPANLRNAGKASESHAKLVYRGARAA